MKYRTLDGRTLCGRSFKDIVRQMSDAKFVEPRSQAAYRRATARRAKDMYGQDIDPATDATFIKTLNECGLLVKV